MIIRLLRASTVLPLLAFCTAPSAAQPPRVEPLSQVVHHRLPDVRLLTTTFICGGTERRFTVRYDIHGFREFASASRGDTDALGSFPAVTAALLELEAIYAIIPQCAPQHDLLTVLGRHQGQQVELIIGWVGTELIVRGMERRDFLPAPRRR